MKIKEALKKVKKNEKIKEILDIGGFFSSGFTTLEPEEMIDNWNLSFYNCKNDMITSIYVSEKEVKLGITDKPLHKNVHRPEIENVKITGKDALKKAKKEFKKYKKPLSKILVSMQKKETEIWNISFITKVGSIINIKIDSKTGKIIKKEEITLFQKYNKAGK